MTEIERTADGSKTESKPDPRDWSTDDAFWQASYISRPYASDDRPYEYYRPAYRYGHESAKKDSSRQWKEAENDLRAGWDRYEHRGASDRSTWEEIKDAAKDAWDRVRGHGDPHRDDRS